ncbi:MAG: hypothetical protein K6G42_04115, partial [Lachnospiraceae bacterium]|nr:hypothetical protein [Lachnospiraceae bacterium]
MSSNEDYLDRLLRSVQDKEEEINTDVLPDLNASGQDVLASSDNNPPSGEAAIQDAAVDPSSLMTETLDSGAMGAPDAGAMSAP